MIAEILPEVAMAVEMRSDPVDIALFPEEEAVIGRAVEQRRREFATARSCARKALQRLGFPPLPIPSGPRGEPCWPAGVVGSITHCNGYRACAVARAAELFALGIDAEPNAPLPDGVLATVARAEELPGLRELADLAPEIHWDRLLFSAKECVYKVWYPITERSLDFEDAVLTVDLGRGAFLARLLVCGPAPYGRYLRRMSGRWLVRDGLVITAIAVPALWKSSTIAYSRTTSLSSDQVLNK